MIFFGRKWFGLNFFGYEKEKYVIYKFLVKCKFVNKLEELGFIVIEDLISYDW